MSDKWVRVQVNNVLTIPLCDIKNQAVPLKIWLAGPLLLFATETSTA